MSGVISALEKSVSSNPLEELSDEEIQIQLIKFGAFCSILHNKKLNDVTVFSLIIKKPIFKKIYMKMIHVDNERRAILYFLKSNPNLHRSKIIKDVLRS